jgi:hypothetical protein
MHVAMVERQGWSRLGLLGALCVSVLLEAKVGCGQDAAVEAPLVKLATAQFAPLNAAETALLVAIAHNGEFDAHGVTEPLRPAVLNWLCTDSAATALVPRRGITLRNAKFAGPCDLRYAKLAVPLSLHGCELESFDVDSAEFLALSLDGSTVQSFRGDQLRVERDLSLKDGFTCRTELRLPFAWIEGHLDLSGAQLLHTQGDALFADGCRVDGDLRLRSGFTAEQRVSLAGARVAGNLDCDAGRFRHADDIALNLPGARIGGDWTLRDATVDGGAVCHGTSVSGDVDADRSRLSFPAGTAFRGYALEVGGDLRFVGAKLSGDVLLEAAEVGRDLNFADAEFDSADPPVDVVLQGLTAVRRFRWTGVKFRQAVPVHLDLRSATTSILFDDRESWPPAGHLRLHGFDYTEIHDDAPFDAASRIEWLRRQHTERFRTQPYEQLAEVFRKGGLAASARDVLIAKEADRAAQAKQLSSAEWFWYRVFGPMIGYGYEPGRALALMIVVVLFGALLFQIGYWRRWMTPMKEVDFVSTTEGVRPFLSPDYPKFNAIVYSLDVFAPLANLHQANYWVPNPQRGRRVPLLFWSPTVGELLRLYLWLHVVAGWTLTSLLIAGLSGLVQH